MASAPPHSFLHFPHSLKLPHGLDQCRHGHTHPSAFNTSLDPPALLIQHPRSSWAVPGAQDLSLPQFSPRSSLQPPRAPHSRPPHTSTMQSGEFVRMVSEIILAPDCPMRFPCRLGAERGAQAGPRGTAGSLVGTGDAAQLCTSLWHHLCPPHSMQDPPQGRSGLESPEEAK